jgi:acyl-CoA reductase-like NAD-dependent aldehyde dehydrogenase
MEYTKKTFDVSTGEETITPLSAEEVAQVEANIAKAQEQAALAATTAAARQAILDRLGLTADEAALLLGAN